MKKARFGEKVWIDEIKVQEFESEMEKAKSENELAEQATTAKAQLLRVGLQKGRSCSTVTASCFSLLRAIGKT